jgi:hypothetical protein
MLKLTPQMEQALSNVDGAICWLGCGLLDSTERSTSAKHGQSPIDPANLARIGDPITRIPPNARVNMAQNTQDHISIIWLKDLHVDAVKALRADKNGAHTSRIQTILSGDALVDRFGNPATTPRNTRQYRPACPGQHLYDRHRQSRRTWWLRRGRPPHCADRGQQLRPAPG